jgi:hypothetical protein
MISLGYGDFMKTWVRGFNIRLFTIRLHLFILVSLLFFPICSSSQGIKGSPSQADLASQRDREIEKFEKEKLGRMKKNVGKWFIIVRSDSVEEFFESPNILQKKFRVKEKETFSVLEVVQNDAGDTNFYRVRMDSGKILYLSADALYLELKIREGRIARLSKKNASSERSQKRNKK